MTSSFQIQPEKPLNPTKQTVRLYYIGSALKKVFPILEDTDQYTPDGVPIRKKTGEKELPATFILDDTAIHAPPIGEAIVLPEYKADQLMRVSRIYGKNGGYVQAWTRDPNVAKAIKARHDDGEYVPATEPEQFKAAIVDGLSDEDLMELLAQRDIKLTKAQQQRLEGDEE